MTTHAAFRAGAAGLLVLALAAPAAASDWKIIDDSDWCREGGRFDRYCEVREIEIPAGRDEIRVDAGPNGGIEVAGWDEDRIRIRAKITVWDVDDDEGEAIAKGIGIDTDREIRADGRGRDWSVSYRIMVPRRSNLSLESRNGGLSVVEVVGTIDMETTNGGIRLAEVGGDVTGRTTNGGLSVILGGDTWEGEGLDIESRNGGVHVEVPPDYDADLTAGTRNGGIRSDFGVERGGWTGGLVRATLGDGGPPLRVMTRNGGIRIEET